MPRGRRRRLRADRPVAWPARLLLLLVSFLALVPLAYASPIDPTWVQGLYDEADHEVALSANSLASLQCATASEARCIPVVAGTGPAGRGVRTGAPLHPEPRALAQDPARSSPLTRSPPLA